MRYSQKIEIYLSCILLILIINFSLAAGAFAGGPRHALVIGNSQYDHALSLANPTNDANSIVQVLEYLKFDVTPIINATRDTMQNSINEFKSKLIAGGREATGLIFYAGHGTQVDGKNYLIPTDARVNARGELTQSIELGWILERLKDAGNSINIVMLDACRNNPFPKTRSLSRSTAMARGLATVTSSSGTLISFATAPGKVAQDGLGTNSPYTEALIANLGTPGLTIEQMFKRVRLRVQQKTNNQQNPWENSSLTREFYFRRSDNPRYVANATATCATPSGPYSVHNVKLNDVLNIRSGPGARYEIEDVLRPGDTGISILTCDASNNWCRIAHGCKDGYVSRKYLKAAPQAVAGFTQRKVDQMQGWFMVHGVAQNDYLSMRAQPNHIANRIVKIPANGNQIKLYSCESVPKYNYKWCYIEYAGSRGYASAHYLKNAFTGAPPN